MKHNIKQLLFLLASALLPLTQAWADTREINNWEELKAFVYDVNHGQWSLDAELMADIVIETNISLESYYGTFNGNGHTLTDYRNDTSADGGFVKYLYGTVKNLKMKDSWVYADGERYCGTIAGVMKGGATIDNCEVEGYVSGWGAGGIAGEASYNSYASTAKTTISNCSFKGSVNGYYANNTTEGGIIGYIGNVVLEMTNCTNYGKIIDNYNDMYNVRMGALVGQISSSATTTFSNNVYNTGTVTLRCNDAIMPLRAIGIFGSNTDVPDVEDQYEGKLLGWEIILIANGSYDIYSVDKPCALAGETVTLTVKGESYEDEYGYKSYSVIREGYPKANIVVDPANAQSRTDGPALSEPIVLEKTGDDTYTFTMPNNKVVIDTYFDRLCLITMEKQWMTFYDEGSYDFFENFDCFQLPEGMKAYYVSAIDATLGTVTIEPMAYAMRGVPMLFERTDDSQKEFWLTPVFPGTVPEVSPCEEYIGVMEGRQFYQSSSVYFLYDGVFRFSDGGALPSHRCYLMIYDSSIRTPQFTLVKSGETTPVTTVNSDVATPTEGYTLSGQRVSTLAKPGLYIVGGKKVIKK